MTVNGDCQLFVVFGVTPEPHRNVPVGVIVRDVDVVHREVFGIERYHRRGGLHPDGDVHSAGERRVGHVRLHGQRVRDRFGVVRQSPGPGPGDGENGENRGEEHSDCGRSIVRNKKRTDNARGVTVYLRILIIL